MRLTTFYAIFLALVLAVYAKTSKTGFCATSPFPQVDGVQVPDKATCSSTALGEIPDVDNMVSTLVLFPTPETTIKANKPFTAAVKVTNLDSGFFLDPEHKYYKVPQRLNKQGKIQGHSHITVQKLKNLHTPPDASKFEFFAALNGKTGKNGLFKQKVDGLSAGLYRLCTLSASASHAPLVMPVAKRGAQDDCVRFRVK
ncbi:8252_t:CDS:1 [Paraglomus brasilianum]|uniref:8252_t:CDS:1 n=1 Tax=Paraglomus brasilianum TaxID=144538 RepID=A0A9N8Z6V0_9GLOM|nr:8252_t:CDS:1 [Paraglomus brasilianum]